MHKVIGENIWIDLPGMRLFFSLLLVSLVLACHNNVNEAEQALTYWSSNNSGEIEFAQWSVAQWNQNHPHQQIRYQPMPEGTSSEEILLAAVVAKTTPDIYSNIWQGSVEFYARSGVLIALDTLVGFMDFLTQRCDAATIAEVTSADGHIYQVPWKINPFMTIYNQDLFADLNLDRPPQTYSEYLKAAEMFKKDLDGDGYVDQWFGDTSVRLAWYQRLFNFYPLYLAASGGMPLIENDRAVFNNEYAVGVFQFLQDLYSNNYFSKQMQSATQDLFVAGKYATKWTGPWEIQYLERFKSDGFSYAFYPMPVPDHQDGPIYTYADPKNMVVFNTCKNPQMAFEFIKSMMNLPGDYKFLQTTNQLPRRAGLDTLAAFQDYFTHNPKMKAFALQSKYVKGVDNCEVMTEVFDIISQEYEACVLYQKKPPQQAITDAEKAINVLLRVKS